MEAELLYALRMLGRFYVEYALLTPTLAGFLWIKVRVTPAARYVQIRFLFQRVTVGQTRGRIAFEQRVRVPLEAPIVKRHTNWHTGRLRSGVVAIPDRVEVAHRQQVS